MKSLVDDNYVENNESTGRDRSQYNQAEDGIEARCYNCSGNCTSCGLCPIELGQRGLGMFFRRSRDTCGFF